MSRLCFKVLQIQKEVLTRRRDKRAGPVAQYKITEHALQNHILHIFPIMSYKTTTNQFYMGFFKNRRRKGNFFKIRRKKVFILFYLKLEKENPNNFLKRKRRMDNFFRN